MFTRGSVHTLPTGWCFHPSRYEKNHFGGNPVPTGAAAAAKGHGRAGVSARGPPHPSLVPAWGTPKRLR